VLGPVGVEIASTRHNCAPPVGYQHYTLTRVMHDVICNEVVLRLADYWGGQGWEVEWLGKYEATLNPKDGSASLLEPDAFLRIQRDGVEQAFVLEYHNERKSIRAAQKVKAYETAYSEGNWKDKWQVESFPPVLVVFWQVIVGEGYLEALQGKNLNCGFYGRWLAKVLEGDLGKWRDLRAKSTVELLPPAAP
jgi:hypothetical protein